MILTHSFLISSMEALIATMQLYSESKKFSLVIPL